MKEPKTPASLDNASNHWRAFFKSFFSTLLFEVLVRDGLTTAPYSFAEVTIYNQTVEDFFTYLDKEDVPWMKAATMFCMVLLGISYLCSFSQTIAKLFNQNDNSFWSATKNRSRKILGVPATFIKVIVSSLAFFLTLVPFLGLSTVITLAIMVCITSILPQLAIYFCPLEKKEVKRISSSEETPLLPPNHSSSKHSLKYGLTYSTVGAYAIANGFQYLQSSTKVLTMLGITNHPISPNGNLNERIIYFSIVTLMIPLVFSTFFTYGHLVENNMGLTQIASPKWDFFKNLMKKVTAFPTTTVKVVCGTAHIYNLMNNLLAEESSETSYATNIAVCLLVIISGFICQISITWGDPTQNIKNSENNPESTTASPNISQNISQTA